MSVSPQPHVFVGYDPVESIAWHVLNHSIQRRAKIPVAVTPVMLSQLTSVMTRDRDPMQSNEFAFSRWLVPWLMNYEGWALWMDCDMLVLDDINKLFAEADPSKAVQVVKHNHKPKETIKYLGNLQTQYERKNWSSVMLFNCGHPACRVLTPEYVNSAPGLDLHQFKWCEDGDIGELPHRWNVLVGYDDPAAYPDPANLHFTIGGPWFHEYRNLVPAWSDLWLRERDSMLHCEQAEEVVRSEVAEVV